MQSKDRETRGLLIKGGNCLVANESLVDVDIRCGDGKIIEIGVSLPPDSEKRSARLSGSAGIIDIHGMPLSAKHAGPNTLFPRNRHA
jgi:hypothetical protein